MPKGSNIVLDESLVSRGLKATGLKSRRALVHRALQDLVRREKQSGLLSLRGGVHWTGNLPAMAAIAFRETPGGFTVTFIGLTPSEG